MKHNWENYFDISSEYWKKVEKIYEDSESFPKKVVKDRNLHHKFPRSFSKKDGAGIDNDEDNLVSLSLADHFRVHYYLWKSAKKGYRAMMAKAFVLMRKRVVVYASDETIEQLAKDYEEAMKEAAEATSKANKGKKLSKETRRRMSEAKKNMSLETKKKMSEARKSKNNPFYGKHHSDESKKKLREAHIGKKLSEEHRNKIGAAMKGNKYALGCKRSEETKKKNAEASKGNTNVRGKHWYNNGKINIMSKECPPGFTPGRIK